ILPLPPSLKLLFLLTLIGLRPCLRSWLLTMISLGPTVEPFILAPLRSVASQTKVNSLAGAFTAFGPGFLATAAAWAMRKSPQMCQRNPLIILLVFPQGATRK